MPRLFTSALFVSLTFVSLALPCQGQSIDPESYYQLASMGQPGKSIGLSKENETLLRAVVATTANEKSQQWKWTQISEGVFRIENRESGSAQFLTVAMEGTIQRVVMKPKEEKETQQWRLVPNADGTVRIRNVKVGSGMSIDIDTEGRLVMRPNNIQRNQLFKMTIVPREEVAAEKVGLEKKPALVMDTATVYRIINEEMPGKSLGVGGFDGRTYKAALVQTRFNKEQEWKIRADGKGRYQIVYQHDPSKVLQVQEAGGEYEVILATRNDSPVQNWQILPAPDGTFQIASDQVGKELPWAFVNDGGDVNAIVLRENHSTVWTFVRRVAPKVTNKNTKPAEETSGQALSTRDRLTAGQELLVDEKLVSPNGKYSLVQQSDGNLVLYDETKKALWASGTNGKSVKHVLLQADGNLVQYLAYKLAVWSTNTHGNPGAQLVIQDDGNLVVYSKDGRALWASNTAR